MHARKENNENYRKHMILCWLVTWSFMSSCKELVVVLSYIDKLYRRPFTKSWLSWNNSDFWRYWEGTVNFALSFTNKFNPNDGTFLFHLNYIYFRQRLPFILRRKTGTHNFVKDVVLTIGLTTKDCLHSFSTQEVWRSM